MIDYKFQGRLTYIPGGPVSVQMSAWPVSGANWWEPTTGSYTAVAAYRAIGAASLAASYVNLVNPGTNDAAPGVAPTFNTATGWTFNGSSTYLTTGIVPNSGWTFLIQYTGLSGSNVYLFGTSNGTWPNARMGIIHNDGGSTTRIENGGANSSGGLQTTGNLAAAGSTGYRNGANPESVPAWSGTTPQAIFIGCRNNAGSPAGYSTANIRAFVVYSTVLDATQMAEISANMAAL